MSFVMHPAVDEYKQRVIPFRSCVAKRQVGVCGLSATSALKQIKVAAIDHC